MSGTIGVNLRVTGHCSQGGRKYMEDAFAVAYQQTEDEKDLEYAFFGIYDGHGGSEAATFAKEHLMDFVVKEKGFWSDKDEEVLRAIHDGYIKTHNEMWKALDKWPKTAAGLPSTAGTTASVAFIRHSKIYIGHVGDSGIILGYQENGHDHWHARPLTMDHKPESVEEKTRIQNSGGKVVVKGGVPRVVWNRPKIGHQGPVRRNTPIDEVPFLAVARSLGDLWSYNPHADEFVVSPEPDLKMVAINTSKYRCLIFGTDGLWNMLSASEAVNIVQNAERHNEHAALSTQSSKCWVNPSKNLVDRALEKWSNTRMRADNTSVVTLMLDPPGPPKMEVLKNRSNNNAPVVEQCNPSLNQTYIVPPDADTHDYVYNNSYTNPDAIVPQYDNSQPSTSFAHVKPISEEEPSYYDGFDDHYNSYLMENNKDYINQVIYGPIATNTEYQEPQFINTVECANQDPYQLTKLQSRVGEESNIKNTTDGFLIREATSDNAEFNTYVSKVTEPSGVLEAVIQDARMNVNNEVIEVLNIVETEMVYESQIINEIIPETKSLQYELPSNDCTVTNIVEAKTLINVEQDPVMDILKSNKDCLETEQSTCKVDSVQVHEISSSSIDKTKSKRKSALCELSTRNMRSHGTSQTADLNLNVCIRTTRSKDIKLNVTLKDYKSDVKENVISSSRKRNVQQKSYLDQASKRQTRSFDRKGMVIASNLPSVINTLQNTRQSPRESFKSTPKYQNELKKTELIKQFSTKLLSLSKQATKDSSNVNKSLSKKSKSIKRKIKKNTRSLNSSLANSLFEPSHVVTRASIGVKSTKNIVKRLSKTIWNTRPMLTRNKKLWK